MTPILDAAAAAALVILIVLVLALVLSARARARRARLRALPGHVPQSPTVIVCPFCRREYDPPETGDRCPGCGAAAPRKR